MLLIDQTVHLRSQSNELCDAMSVVLTIVHISLHGVKIRECMSKSGLKRSCRSNVPLRLCNRTERRTCCDVFDVSTPPCSWIQATDDDTSHRIHAHSTHIREIARSMPCFQQSDTYARHWDHQLVYEELLALVSLLSRELPLRAPCLTDTLVNQESVDLIGKLPLNHIVLGCQSFPGLSVNLDLSSSLGLIVNSSRWASI